MAFKGAIFDLDGVIVHTVPLHFKAWKRMFAEYGKPDFTMEDYKHKVDGIPRVDGCRAILTGASDQTIKEACDKKQDYYLEYLKEQGAEVYETTIQLIKELTSKGIRPAVISSSKNCARILDKAGLTELFDIQINGNDITKGKPDPQIFLMSAEQLGLDTSECVVFEDATLGVEAAKNAKMKCVGIDRHGTPEILSKADIVVSDLGEVNFEKVSSLFNS